MLTQETSKEVKNAVKMSNFYLLEAPPYQSFIFDSPKNLVNLVSAEKQGLSL